MYKSMENDFHSNFALAAPYNIPNTNNRDSLYVFAIIGKQIYGFMPDVLL